MGCLARAFLRASADSSRSTFFPEITPFKAAGSWRRCSKFRDSRLLHQILGFRLSDILELDYGWLRERRQSLFEQHLLPVDSFSSLSLSEYQF